MSKPNSQALWAGIEILEKNHDVVIVPMTVAEARAVFQALGFARDAATLPEEARWVGDRISLRLFERGDDKTMVKL